jgi:hypothetical protein
MNAGALYIYYKIDAAQAAVARRVLERMVAEIAARAAIVGRLLHRREDALTWIEVYEPLTDAAQLKRLLDEAVERYGARRFLASGSARVKEEFVPFS